MIEVGEYVRDEEGYILKIDNDYVLENVERFIEGYRILKHSKNIIDLIEVGDYVNRYKVINVINEGPCPSGKCVDIDSSMDSSKCTLWQDEIKTIVTKEQFENMEYKVV